MVRDYGDVCQVITELAIEQEANISGDEFRTLNLCLDDVIANAATEYARLREHTIAAAGTERLGILAHEQRNLLAAAICRESRRLWEWSAEVRSRRIRRECSTARTRREWRSRAVGLAEHCGPLQLRMPQRGFCGRN